MAKRQFRVLYREFLFRMVDLELLSVHAQGDASRLLGQFAALLAFLGVLFSMPAMMGFGDANMPPPARLMLAWSMEHFLIATTMLVIGLFAVLSWDSTFPNRRDVLVLAPLPVRARTIFLAKVAAIGTALSLAVLILHAVAGLAWAFALNQSSATLTIPALTSDPPLRPVEAADLKSVLDRDLAAALNPGSGMLAPGKGTGVVIAVSKHGVRRILTYGDAKPNSMFEIGSVTKTFTGLLLARMVAQGKVRFDEPVRVLLPAGTVEKPGGAEITLADLATQHSGLPRLPGNFHPSDKTNPYADYHAEDLYAYLAKRGVRKPAQPSFLYSNLGVGLLGQALANRSGVSYADLVREQITDPLGMRDTRISLWREQQNRLIQGHDAEGRPVRAWEIDALAGAGALRSTAVDMLRYVEANLEPQETRLRAALLESHRVRAEAAPGMRIALAWFYYADNGTYWHAGATAGYTADAFFNPRRGYAGVVLSNVGPGSVISADLLGDHVRSRLEGTAAISVASISIPPGGGFSGVIRLFAAYWMTTISAGLFIFCSVLAMQGLAAQVLPRRWFLRFSSFLQMAAFCLFVSVYFLQPIPVSPAGLIEAQNQGLLAWSPSYWFLGLFQKLNGSPALAPLARRAWTGLAAAFGATAVAYWLSYVRTLRKIAEEPDIVPSSRHISWQPRFGNLLETAITQFSMRTLLRSRQHRMIVAFYLGVAFALVIFFLKTPAPAQQLPAAAAGDSWRQVTVPLLGSSIIVMGFWVLGIRVAFSVPVNLGANWIFRLTPLRGGRASLAARRRALLVLAVAPVWAASAVLFLYLWPWRPAAGHLAVLALLAIILVELCLLGVQKIPFACAYLPGKSNIHVTFWLCALLLVRLIGWGAELERRALENSSVYLRMFAVLAAAAILVRWRAATTASGDAELHFDEAQPGEIIRLDLQWGKGASSTIAR